MSRHALRETRELLMASELRIALPAIEALDAFLKEYLFREFVAGDDATEQAQEVPEIRIELPQQLTKAPAPPASEPENYAEPSDFLSPDDTATAEAAVQALTENTATGAEVEKAGLGEHKAFKADPIYISLKAFHREIKSLAKRQGLKNNFQIAKALGFKGQGIVQGLFDRKSGLSLTAYGEHLVKVLGPSILPES